MNYEFLTVYGDASYCDKTSAAGYAYWIKYGSRGLIIKDCDSFMTTSSIDAEIYALERAIEHALSLTINNHIMVIRSDCEAALKNVKLNYGDRCNDIHHAVYYKWIKGHQGCINAGSSVNTWCDVNAKRKMRTLRDSIYDGYSH